MKKVLLKFAIVLFICFAVHILASLFSSLTVNSFILNTRLANFTFYDGYADFSIFLAYVLLSALLIFNKIKGNVWLIAIGSFIAFVVVKAFVIDAVEHYLRFYLKTEQNGAYSFEVFKENLASQWDSFLFEFSNLGQAFSTVVWVFLALLGVCYLSLWVKYDDKGNFVKTVKY